MEDRSEIQIYPTSLSKVLAIGGSDSGSGAGIQADIKTITALGGYATSAITALTAQNTTGVHSIFEIPASFVARQIDAIMTDIGAEVIKTGMLVNKEIVEVIGLKIREYNIIRVVVDPVMLSKNGRQLLLPGAIETLVSAVFPVSLLVTPNIPEAERLSGVTIQNLSDARKAAERIYRLGPSYVLIKGGHADMSADMYSRGQLTDILYNGKSFEYIRDSYIPTKNTHGTGCTYASAIATFLAKGYGVKEATIMSRKFITRSIQKSVCPGSGYGTLNQFGAAQLP